MHVLMLSLVVAFVVCVALLGVFGLFTVSPPGRHVEEHERRHRLKPS